MKKAYFLIAILYSLTVFSSCESEVEKKQREARNDQLSIELNEKQEQEKLRQAVIDKYISNSLSTGATPYAYCFGSNNSCIESGCSQIKVKTPHNSDVLVTIKKNDKVFRHAYIGQEAIFHLNYLMEFTSRFSIMEKDGIRIK